MILSKQLAVLTLFVALVFVACKKETVQFGAAPEYDVTPYNLELTGSLTAPTIPLDNPLTVQKVKLGKMLFFEKQLSLDGSINCSSCHNQEHGFSDPNRLSIGVNGSLGKRQAMSIVNMAWNANGYFWDGRSSLLRHQALMPIQDPLEMKETIPSIIAKLQSKQLYRNQFLRAFGTMEVTEERISFALENYMLTIVSDNSKYDNVVLGNASYTASEQRGFDLFMAEYNPFFPESSGADCFHCHSGSNFENDTYANNGLDSDAEFTDLGRFNVTGNNAHKAAFKVPTLRNVALTAPYMHDGRFTTLEEVVEHYDHGLKQSSSVNDALAGTIPTGLMLTAQDKKDLVNFLKTLTDLKLKNNPAFKN